MANEIFTVEVNKQHLNKILNKLSAASQFRVSRNSLMQSAAWMAGWSVKYRMSGKRPKYLDRVSGYLVNSILQSVRAAYPVQRGDMAVLTYGSDMPYAAIHEYGGNAGKGGKVKIPARPYMQPAVEEANRTKKLEQIFLKNIKRELGRS